MPLKPDDEMKIPMESARTDELPRAAMCLTLAHLAASLCEDQKTSLFARTVGSAPPTLAFCRGSLSTLGVDTGETGCQNSEVGPLSSRAHPGRCQWREAVYMASRERRSTSPLLYVLH